MDGITHREAGFELVGVLTGLNGFVAISTVCNEDLGITVLHDVANLLTGQVPVDWCQAIAGAVRGHKGNDKLDAITAKQCYTCVVTHIQAVEVTRQLVAACIQLGPGERRMRIMYRGLIAFGGGIDRDGHATLRCFKWHDG